MSKFLNLCPYDGVIRGINDTDWNFQYLCFRATTDTSATISTKKIETRISAEDMEAVLWRLTVNRQIDSIETSFLLDLPATSMNPSIDAQQVRMYYASNTMKIDRLSGMAFIYKTSRSSNCAIYCAEVYRSTSERTPILS